MCTMGLILRYLIIFILRFLKLIGDATIWLIETQYLAIIFIAKLLRSVLTFPIIVFRIATRYISYAIKTIGKSVRKIHIPNAERLTSFSSFKNKSMGQSIGHNSKQPTKQSSGTMWPAVKNFMRGFTVASIILGVASGYTLLSQDLPHPQLLTKRDIPLTTKIYEITKYITNKGAR